MLTDMLAAVQACVDPDCRRRCAAPLAPGQTWLPGPHRRFHGWVVSRDGRQPDTSTPRCPACQCPSPPIFPTAHPCRSLKALADLFALDRIYSDTMFRNDDYIAPEKAKAIHRLIQALCGELRGVAVPLVDAFAIPDHILRR
jgi:hypothetical protein